MINRVNKRTARRAYNEGKDVLIFPRNLRPDFFGVIVNNRRNEKDFDKLINAFEFYNCTNAETGRYCAYIIN